MSGVLMKLVGVGSPHNSKRRGALIIPSAAPGSIGDDAMVMSLVTELHEAEEGPVEVLARGGAAGWPDVSPGRLLELPSGRRRLLGLVSAMRRVKRVFVIGADCLDGHYSPALSLQLIRSADLGAHSGAMATIVGSSYKASPLPETVEALKRLHANARVCGRDPRTVERIRTLTGRACELVTDSAFMLRPHRPETDAAAAHLSWIDERRSAGRILLGVNFNRQVLGKKADPDRIESLLSAHEAAISRLLAERPGLDVLFIPHDYRGTDSDRDHAVLLGERLGGSGRVRSLGEAYRASEIKYFASKMDMILTGRMHLAIEALGAGVPVTCITYQDKFEGLFDHLRLEPRVLAPEQVTAESLHGLLAENLDRLDAYRAHVAEQMARIRAMSRLNLGLETSSEVAARA